VVKRALACALAATSCGLLPAPGPSPPIAGDGVAAFGDASPIQLCLGTANVVPPEASTGADAVCVAGGASGAACTAGTDCAGIESCVCGQCIIQACAGAAPCGGSLVCRDGRCTQPCSEDSDCPSGGQCDTGGCTRGCAQDSDCYFGESCDDLFNVCVAKICSPAVLCGAGSTCEPITAPFELHEPEVVVVGGATVAYVELRTEGTGGAGATSEIYRARVDSPSRWTADPITPVLPAVGGQSAGAPSALVDGEQVDLYFAAGDGQALAHAVSTDGGVTFTRDATPVLTPAEGWEQGWIGSPGVVRYGAETLLFYEGGPRAGVGMAKVGTGGVATRVGTAPIVTPAIIEDPLAWQYVTEVGAPYALVAGDILRVYFTGRGVPGTDAIVGGALVPADADDSIGLVASLDGVTFTPYPSGPVLTRMTNLRAYLGSREAAVRLLAGGGAEINFVATDASGEDESGLSRAATAP
jgi:hypothetical protein